MSITPNGQDFALSSRRDRIFRKSVTEGFCPVLSRVPVISQGCLNFDRAFPEYEFKTSIERIDNTQSVGCAKGRDWVVR